jgi:diphthine-ammonia ligase
MKFIALVSGGKDSLYSTLECVRNGHELVACVHLGAPATETEESYMYQTAASEVLPTLVEECLGVPLILHERVGTSINTLLVYESTSEDDEVEDLYFALKKAKDHFPEIKGVSSGAILSTYQRVRIEHVCSRLGLTSFSYLWRMAPQHDLLKRMMDDGIEAVLVKTACPPGLVPQKHLNKTIGELYYSGLFHKLHDKYQFHMCGEGGEYESLVLDCPLYKKKLVLDEVEIVETNDGVGSLIIKRCHAEAKTEVAPMKEFKEHTSTDLEAVSTSTLAITVPQIRFLPHVKRLSGGLIQTSEIMSSIPAFGEGWTESDCSVQEALDILQQLGQVLKQNDSTAQDVIFVHLYLSEISHFGNINNHYRDFFGTLLPPSRTCVAVGKRVLPGGRRVLLDCLIQCGSGAYLRSSQDGGAYAKAAACSKSTKLREVLHVQSLSYWAPVCVGPYSQVNTLRSGLHFLAGKIGLKPSSMTLHDTWTAQFGQCWTNLARVLDALDGSSLEELLSCLIYVSGDIDDWAIVESIGREQLATNGSVVPGAVDSADSLESIYGGYEDEETWREMTRNERSQSALVPLLLVSIPEMPVGAQVEIEAICCTKKASTCLERVVTARTQKYAQADAESPGIWDCGYDFANSTRQTCEVIVESVSSSLGQGCATMCTITASLDENSQTAQFVDIGTVLARMIQEGFASLKSNGLCSENIVHVRVYHATGMCDDGIRLRSALASALVSGAKQTPASSVIPVQRIKLITDNEGCSSFPTVLALQLLAIDPVQLDTDLWVHHGRE